MKNLRKQHDLKKLEEDKKKILDAVNENGFNLYYASQKLKDDKDIVQAAVTKNG
jgi:L-lactate utilization protein LutB